MTPPPYTLSVAPDLCIAAVVCAAIAALATLALCLTAAWIVDRCAPRRRDDE